MGSQNLLTDSLGTQANLVIASGPNTGLRRERALVTEASLLGPQTLLDDIFVEFRSVLL